MTAAELASFRALLQAQATPPPRPDQGLFARMRARLRVVERTEPPPGPVPPRSAVAGAAHSLAVVVVPEPSVECPTSFQAVADPPPSVPPAFGRRPCEPQPAPAAPAQVEAAPETRPGLEVVRLRRAAPLEEVHSTPEEDVRPPRAETPTGVIAGWSPVRPASAQQRVLQRLEAVLSAERQGLEARRAALAAA